MLADRRITREAVRILSTVLYFHGKHHFRGMIRSTIMMLLVFPALALAQGETQLFMPDQDDQELKVFVKKMELCVAFNDTTGWLELLADTVSGAWGNDPWSYPADKFISLKQNEHGVNMAMPEFISHHCRFGFSSCTTDSSEDAPVTFIRPVKVGDQELMINYPINPTLRGEGRNFMDDCPMIILNDKTELKKNPSADSQVLGLAQKGCACASEGSCLEIPGYSQSDAAAWYFVYTQNGQSGWVHTSQCLSYVDYYTSIYLIKQKGRWKLRYLYTHPGC
ncbi:MAG: hypothetical protein HKN32_04850 [Flavobacteriales bacterium]|nr:hypothetical protein [Flavobacteriales bacterium]